MVIFYLCFIQTLQNTLLLNLLNELQERQLLLLDHANQKKIKYINYQIKNI